MILHPSILALLVASLLTSLMTLHAARYALQVLRRWDISSGSELQLTLERKTYLVSTVVGYFLVFQLISLFMFIRSADGISHLFVGAMCAVGTLTAGSLGYPALLLKTVTFILGGLWLILNHADNQGYDYPLIKAKYLLLLFMVPFILAETVLQGIYFGSLRPDIITSCCGSLFSQGSRGIASEILAAPAVPMQMTFYICMLATLAAGARLLLRGKGGYLYAGLSGISFAVALASMVSFVSLYVYEMPSHHCPFCILQREYGYVGYPLYALLLLATVTGLAVGMLQRYRDKESLRELLPALQRKLAAVSVISFLVFTAIVTERIWASALKL